MAVAAAYDPSGAPPIGRGYPLIIKYKIEVILIATGSLYFCGIMYWGEGGTGSCQWN